jgi:hypothetical protein
MAVKTSAFIALRFCLMPGQQIFLWNYGAAALQSCFRVKRQGFEYRLFLRQGCAVQRKSAAEFLTKCVFGGTLRAVFFNNQKG